MIARHASKTTSRFGRRAKLRLFGRRRVKHMAVATPIAATGEAELLAVVEDTMRRFPETMARLAE